jgi:hypothetical protein
LSKGDKIVIARLSKKLKKGATVTIVAYAKGDLAAARERASSVADFLKSLVKVHVVIDLKTNAASSSFTVKSP